MVFRHSPELFVLGVVTALALGVIPAASGVPGFPAGSAPSAGAAQRSPGSVTTLTVTLITGDKVTVRTAGDGSSSGPSREWRERPPASTARSWTGRRTSTPTPSCPTSGPESSISGMVTGKDSSGKVRARTLIGAAKDVAEHRSPGRRLSHGFRTAVRPDDSM